MKFLNLLFLLTSIILFSCEQPFKEVTQQSNENNIKIKLELSEEKSKPGTKASFTLRLINIGERDLGRCTLRLDNKYEHQLEGLINKTEDWEGKTQTSMLKSEESATIVFDRDIDNYDIFGIRDDNFSLPETIELNCLDGKVVWKLR
jgi:hypothetical protein